MSLPATSFRPRPSPPPLPSRRGAGLPRPPPPEGWSEARGSEVTPRVSAASRGGEGKAGAEPPGWGLGKMSPGSAESGGRRCGAAPRCPLPPPLLGGEVCGRAAGRAERGSVCVRVCARVCARIPAAGVQRLRSAARPGSAPVSPVRAVTRPP